MNYNLKINKDFSDSNINYTEYSDDFFKKLQEATISKVILRDNEVIVTVGPSVNNDVKKVSKEYFKKFIADNYKNIFVTRASGLQIEECLNKIYSDPVLVTDIEWIRDTAVKFIYSNKEEWYIETDNSDLMVKKLDFLLSSKDKFSDFAFSKITEFKNNLEKALNDSKKAKEELKRKRDELKNERAKKKRLEEKLKKQEIIKIDRDAVKKSIEEKALKEPEALKDYYAKLKEDRERVLKDVEAELNGGDDFLVDSYDFLLEEFIPYYIEDDFEIYNYLNTWEVLNKKTQEQLLKINHNYAQQKHQFKSKYILDYNKAFGTELTLDEIARLDITELFEKEREKKELEDFKKNQKRKEYYQDLANGKIKEIDFSINKEKEESIKAIKSVSDNILRNFKVNNHHTNLDKLRSPISVDVSNVKSILMSSLNKKPTRNTDKIQGKNIQPVMGIVVSTKETITRNGMVKELKFKDYPLLQQYKDGDQQYDLYRVNNLKKMPVPSEYIRNGIIDTYYGCVLAATFFQMLVSSTPKDEMYDYEETRYIVTGTRGIKLKDTVKSTGREFSTINDAQEALELFLNSLEGTSYYKTPEEIREEAKEKLKIKKIKVKKVHKPDEDYVRRSWELSFRRKKFLSGDFDDSLFLKTGDEESIYSIAMTLYTATVSSKTKNNNFTYKNLNSRWEMLEYGYYNSDSGPFSGSRYGSLYSHGIKNHHSYQAPKGFLRLVEAMWNSYCESGKQFESVANFINDNKDFCVSNADDVENSIMQRLVKSNKSVSKDTYDIENWRKVFK